MGYLVSAGVITFQIVIFITILGAARVGNRALALTTIGWTCFTLFGSIFTAGLLLLQLATIAVAYNIGKRRVPSGPSRGNVSVPKQKNDSDGWIITAILIVVGMAAGGYFGRESAKADMEKLRQIRAAGQEAQQSLPTSHPTPPQRHPIAERERNAKKEARDEDARRRLLERTPEL